MEVYHHANPEGKKFKQYFWEFFMLFLAVSAGFLVENLREHYVERLRAKEYAGMLLEDLKKDTAELKRSLRVYERNIQDIDTLIEMVTRRNFQDIPADSFYYYSSPAISYILKTGFYDATLQQLKNSGNMRYLSSLAVKKKIGEYDVAIRNFNMRQDFEMLWGNIMLEYKPKLESYLFNMFVNKILLDSNGVRGKAIWDAMFTEFNGKYVLEDSEKLRDFINIAAARMNTFIGRSRNNIQPTLAVAEELIFLLESAYPTN